MKPVWKNWFILLGFGLAMRVYPDLSEQDSWQRYLCAAIMGGATAALAIYFADKEERK